MTDPLAALTEALRSEFSEWVEPDDVDEIAWDYKAAAILAHPAMASVARKAAAWDDTERVARMFHEAYERLAPDHGYETRRESAVPWESVPEQNRALMVATVAAIAAALEQPMG